MSRVFVPAFTVHWYSSYISSGAVLPQLWVERVLFPCVCDSVHPHHHAQMGREGCSETYSKVRPSARLCDALPVTNTAFSTSRWKVTMLPLVPSMILQLVNSPELEKTDTSSIETLGSGGAFLPPELHARFKSKLESTLIQGYGVSEAVRVHPFGSVILEISTLINPRRPSQLRERCEKMGSLGTSRSINQLVFLCPACRPGSFVRTVWMVVSENLVNFGSREAVSLEVTSMMNRPLRRCSPKTGGSRPAISLPSMRREITSEISCGSRLIFCSRS